MPASGRLTWRTDFPHRTGTSAKEGCGPAGCEKVIDRSRKEGWLDISPFVDYMLDIFEEAMTSAALANNELSKMEQLVLERMNKAGIHAEITVKNAMKITKLSESSTRDVLLNLTNQGYLQINKETKPYVYKLMPHM